MCPSPAPILSTWEEEGEESRAQALHWVGRGQRSASREPCSEVPSSPCWSESSSDALNPHPRSQFVTRPLHKRTELHFRARGCLCPPAQQCWGRSMGRPALQAFLSHLLPTRGHSSTPPLLPSGKLPARGDLTSLLFLRGLHEGCLQRVSMASSSCPHRVPVTQPPSRCPPHTVTHHPH